MSLKDVDGLTQLLDPFSFVFVVVVAVVKRG
jgi:hypothetical protein